MCAASPGAVPSNFCNVASVELVVACLATKLTPGSPREYHGIPSAASACQLGLLGSEAWPCAATIAEVLCVACDACGSLPQVPRGLDVPLNEREEPLDRIEFQDASVDTPEPDGRSRRLVTKLNLEVRVSAGPSNH